MSYKNVLLTDEDTIKTYSNISDNIDGNYLLPAISMAQKIDLQAVIGSPLLKKLQKLVFDNKIDEVEHEDYKELLDEYVTDYLTYCSIVRLIPIVSFKINNMGAVRTEDDKVIGLNYSDTFNLKDYYQMQADYLKYRLQNYLIANYSNFRELSAYKSIDEIKANLISAHSCNIFLG